MTQPWWQYFAILEDTKFSGTYESRLLALIVFSLTTIITTIIALRFFSKLRHERGMHGGRTKNYYYLLIIALYLILLNSFFIRLSAFLTDGKWVVFSREKGVLFIIGAYGFVVASKNICFDVINFTKRGKSIVSAMYFGLLGITFFNLTVQLLYIFQFETLREQTITLIAITGFLSSIFILIFVLGLFQERRADPSKIEQLRLLLLALALLMMLVELMVVAYGSELKDAGNSFFVTWSAYYLPIVYLVVHPLMYIFFYWSLFTPNWLLIRTGVIQPSFRRFLAKEK